ncbi:UNVERIFIED_CONTAM: hypothetical protein NY603_25820, partial [Bacteroidetes bacterium 56_B9]
IALCTRICADPTLFLRANHATPAIQRTYELKMPPKASYKPYLPQIEAFFKENELSSPYDLNATLFNQAYDLARLARPASDKQMANFFKYL